MTSLSLLTGRTVPYMNKYIFCSKFSLCYWYHANHCHCDSTDLKTQLVGPGNATIQDIPMTLWWKVNITQRLIHKRKKITKVKQPGVSWMMYLIFCSKFGQWYCYAYHCLCDLTDLKTRVWPGNVTITEKPMTLWWKDSITQLHQGFFLVSSGAEIRLLSQWDLGVFFPNLKKNPKSKKKKKKKIFFFFFFFRIFIQSPHTHTHKLHDNNLLESHPIFLQFNGNSMCNS